MLPEDTSARKKAVVLAQQATLDPHLRERALTERVIRYSDDLFQEAAITWLVSTDQVCCMTLCLSVADRVTSLSKRLSMRHSRG